MILTSSDPSNTIIPYQLSACAQMAAHFKDQVMPCLANAKLDPTSGGGFPMFQTTCAASLLLEIQGAQLPTKSPYEVSLDAAGSVRCQY